MSLLALCSDGTDRNDFMLILRYVLPVAYYSKGLWPLLTLPLWALLAFFALVYSWWFMIQPFGSRNTQRSISHLIVINSICFQFFVPGSIVPTPRGLRLSCPFQPMLLGSPCPLRYLLTLSPGFVNFRVCIWSVVHPTLMCVVSSQPPNQF